MPGCGAGAVQGVLCLAALLSSAVAQAPEAAAGPASDCTPLAEALEMNSLSQLATLLATPGATELAFNVASVTELPENDKVTIFAPVDTAIAAAPASNDTSEVLFNHVVLQYLPSDARTAGTEALSLGGLVTISSDADGDLAVSAPGMPTPAKITMPDILTCVGVLHIIDTVITRTDDGALAPVAAPTAATTPTAPSPAGADGATPGTDSSGPSGASGDDSTTAADRSADGVTDASRGALSILECAVGSLAAIVVAAVVAAA